MEPDPLVAQVEKLSKELDKRAKHHRLMDKYYEAQCPLPDAIRQARVTKAYRMLMPMAASSWAALIVDSVHDRLEVSGIKSGDAALDKLVWDDWQASYLDSESLLAHNAALVDGRAFALVWPEGRGADRRPRVTLDDSSQMIVQYAEGSRHIRVAALRRWIDDESGRTMATLYRPDGIFKYQSRGGEDGPGASWVKREVRGERWPLKNPYKVVPVVELNVNRRLSAGVWGSGRGEFQSVTGHIDRLQTLTFLQLVVAFWMGFPIRVLIGEKILKDDDGVPIPPFKAAADEVAQFENPNVKLDEYKAADVKNLSIVEHVEQLATVTKTPRHYFPLGGGMSNLSADAIRASEGALNSKVTGHKGSLGEGWEEVHRLMALIRGKQLPASAELGWKDHESRSMAERADAAVKLAKVMPWTWVAERVLNVTQAEIDRQMTLRAGDGLLRLVADLADNPVGDPDDDRADEPVAA